MGSTARDGQPESTPGQFLLQLLQNPRHHESPSPPHPHRHLQHPNPNRFNPHIDTSRVENQVFDYSSNWNGNVKERISQVGNFDGFCSSSSSSGGDGQGFDLGNGQGFSGSGSKFWNNLDGNRSFRGNVGGFRGGNGLREQQGYCRSYSAVAPPPGFCIKSSSGVNRDNVGNRGSDLEKLRSNVRMMSRQEADFHGEGWGIGRSTHGNWKHDDGVPSSQGGPNSGIQFNSVALNEFEESGNCSTGELDDLNDKLASVLEIEARYAKEKAKGSRDKDYRSDKRGQWILGQRIRIMKRQTVCRRDIDLLNAPFLTIYKSLIPPVEEKEKQEKLLTTLVSLVKEEWPQAQLYVYGSCANSFGFSKSDTDICLVLRNMGINKSEVLLKLAEKLELNNFQNVQALTHARVPIVKFMDPNTGIFCDVCINNILAVINTKLLHDYARIDGRLRQLAFIVKYWAKRRGVNKTYQGTLSSYAYVLMCISFLQQRKPAILPCLQGMEPTYSVTVENIECAYFNEVDKLQAFGVRNGETIAHLVWSFFNYWAYYHDYTSDVISVRTGSTLSKDAKDWTRRIGNDRHLICIEDPFSITHDLGRVVDKASIRVLREEFERAAQIMQHDVDPCTKLFEPYVPA